MPETNLTVTIEADTEAAVEAIDAVTDAVERLNEALDELEDTPIPFRIRSDNTSSNAVEWDFTTTTTVPLDDYTPNPFTSDDPVID